MGGKRRAVTVAGLVLALVVYGAGSAPAAPRWQRQIANLTAMSDLTTTLAASPLPTPDAGDGIGPGSKLIITMDGDPNTYGCTANYLWTDGSRTLLGAAGHCFLPVDKTATAGPGADYNAAHTHVQVCVAGCLFGGQTGFILTGTLADLGPVVYARQLENGEDIGNDFGLVEIPDALAPYLRPTMPVWGGPSGVATVGTGSPVCLYGNATVLGEVFLTKARLGVGISSDSNAWRANIPSLEGDSGAALNICGSPASAAGILTHRSIGLNLGVIAGTTVSRAAEMAQQAGLFIEIVTI